ncbi:class I SAM-dependent methyltransferase, partial [Escherichia coli]|nr:class I SAM-dependent methyltransferase [Escherichia coli]
MYTEKYLPNGKYNMDNAERYEMTPPQSILEFAELKDGMTVCDIGCGTGFYTETAAKMNPN